MAIESFDATEDLPIESCIEFDDLVLLPGLVDPHVHLNEPGRTHWEGFESGTAAAAAGGVTTLVDMPLNSTPVTTTLDALRAKRVAASKAPTGELYVDVGFYAGLVPGNEDEIESLLDAGVLGVKAFLRHSGIDDFPAATERELQIAMPLLAKRNVPLLVHAELVSDAPAMTDPQSYADYVASRPPSFERNAIKLMIKLCRETGCRTHIVHLADAACLAMLGDARRDGLPITVETCPHYLTFAAEEIADGATQYKCAPPIRDVNNREGLWRGLADGVIDFIASDHSPCPPEMKEQESGRFDLAWGGISSLQLTLPIVWSEASKRGHTLDDVVRWLSYKPAELIGRTAGIQVGAEANFLAFDPTAEFVVRGADLAHRHPLTPYEGRTLRGVVTQTYLRGEPTGIGKGICVESKKTLEFDIATELNKRAPADAQRLLRRCCGSIWWCEQVVAERPFDSQTQFLNTVENVFDKMPKEAWLESFACHPKIGDMDSLKMRFTGNRQWSAGEQAGMAAAEEETLKQFSQANAEYENRFGYIFIVCASGKTASEMLAMLQARLKNDPDDELAIASNEQRKITMLRLEKLNPNE